MAKKQKDPAVLFYTSDFLTGTMFMSDLQVGKYIRLLCVQHQHGGIIPRSVFDQAVGNDDLIKSKFVECEAGFYNERMADEMERRQQKSSKMATNAKQRVSKSTAIDEQLHSKSIAIAQPIENENENENAIEYNNERIDIFSDAALFEVFNSLYLDPLPLAFKGIDIQSELKQFILKIRGAPDQYGNRDVSGIRNAFLYHLRTARTKNNATTTNRQQNNLTSLVAGFAARHGADAHEGQ